MLGPGVSGWLSERIAGRVDTDENGSPVMTARTVRSLCLQNDGFECEEINDVLYLHFQGFRRIENLEKYTGVKSLHLESNSISEVENISHMNELRSLCLRQNIIKSLNSLVCFRGLAKLVILDVSENLLEVLDGISTLVALQKANFSMNRLSNPESLADLVNCKALQSVDLRGNNLSDHEKMWRHLESLPDLSALYLQGNPCVKERKHYRKTLIANLTRLSYLDERPVEPYERRFAKAFVSGGKEAEKKAREEWKAEEKARAVSRAESWKVFREDARSKPRKASEKFVSYRTVSASEEDERQDRIRRAAVAETEATRLSSRSHGIAIVEPVRDEKGKQEDEEPPLALEEVPAPCPPPPAPDAFGILMPKIIVPSVKAELLPCCSLTGTSSEEDEEINHFSKRLTRSAILEALHGSDNHPLNVDLHEPDSIRETSQLDLNPPEQFNDGFKATLIKANDDAK